MGVYIPKHENHPNAILMNSTTAYMTIKMQGHRIRMSYSLDLLN